MKSRFYRTATPLTTQIQKLFSHDLAQENDFLRQENKILRSKLGKRVPLTETDHSPWPSEITERSAVASGSSTAK